MNLASIEIVAELENRINKKRSISMRSTRTKPSGIKSSRNSELNSERSYSFRDHERHMSINKHADPTSVINELQQDLAGERKKNYQLNKTIQQLSK